MTDPARLACAGRLLLGPDWQQPLARALGPLHPGGAREAIDYRLVRRWASGERPIPAWVWPTLAKLARERLAGARHDLTELEAVASWTSAPA